MTPPRCRAVVCACACHLRRVRQPPRIWTPELDDALRSGLAAGSPLAVIAARLALSLDALRWRARQLGLSLRDGWRSRQEVRLALGVGWRDVNRWWRDGRLRVTPHGTRWTRVNDADLRLFVTTYAGVLFEPTTVADPALRRLAETSAIVNRRRAS